MDLHYLPLAVLEVEDVGRARVEGPARPGERELHARPPDSALLPGVDLVPGDREATELLDLPPPDEACLLAAPPLGKIAPVRSVLPRRRSSEVRRSWKVPQARSIRPFACGEPARIDVIPSSASARATWVASSRSRAPGWVGAKTDEPSR